MGNEPWDRMCLIKTTGVREEREDESTCIRKANLIVLRGGDNLSKRREPKAKFAPLTIVFGNFILFFDI